MTALPDPREHLVNQFGPGGDIRVVSVPGRVNLIGEHIDYHGLPVLPIAIGRRVHLAFRARPDRRIRAVSTPPYGPREFEWTAALAPAAAGDWENYIRAAAQLIGPRPLGIDAAVVSDLPAAAGLSSSTALLVAFTLALLAANDVSPSFEALMDVLPDGEQFVGTRGGGMDHAAVLASRPGHASLIDFNPVSVRPIPVPAEWGFLVAHSLETAEKSAGARQGYNSRRAAGSRALERLGFPSYKAAAEANGAVERLENLEERDAFLHATSEARRVRAAVGALEEGDAARFGRLLGESHASLRDRLRVSCPALDRLVEAARAAGALGARLTGGGFGGCAVVFGRRGDLPEIRRGLIERFYAGRPEFDEERHLIEASPAAGVLHLNRT